jgi:hypothetical protein
MALKLALHIPCVHFGHYYLLSCNIDVSGAGAPEGADARAGGEEQLEHGAASDQEEAGRAGQSEGTFSVFIPLKAVLRIRIRIRRIRMFLGLLDPDPDPLVRGIDPDPSIVKQK